MMKLRDSEPEKYRDLEYRYITVTRDQIIHFFTSKKAVASTQ